MGYSFMKEGAGDDNGRRFFLGVRVMGTKTVMLGTKTDVTLLGLI